MDNAFLFDTVQQAHPYPLLFATIGGSHAFGYATPSSDYDVHGVHQVPLEEVASEQITRTVKNDALVHPETGQKVEMVTHDLGKFRTLLLSGNSNALEDLYSPFVVSSSEVHQELLELGKGCITLSCALSYKSMAQNQQYKMKNNETKKFLHMYRCLLMGTYLMQTGQFEMNLPRLAEHFVVPEVFRLIEAKQEVLPSFMWVPALVSHHQATVEQWFERLRLAAEASHLPARPSEATRKALEALLIRVRLGEK